MKTIHIQEQHWPLVRELRLEMLADTPLAYVETLQTAEAAPDEEWKFRARRCSEPQSIGLAAVDDSGRWVGTMSAFVADDGRPLLVGVYVSPPVRGTGVADLLLDQIEAWATAVGGTALTLEVHESNTRAQAFYVKRGYVATGDTVPYPLDPTQRELVMVRDLAAGR